MRRRSTFESMEKGTGTGKNSRSNVRLLILLFVFIFVLLFCFQFVVLGGSSVDYRSLPQSRNDNARSIEDRTIKQSREFQSASTTKRSPELQSTLPINGSRGFQSDSARDSHHQQDLATNLNSDEQMEVEASSEETVNYRFSTALRSKENTNDCGGRYIYVHDLPPRFNEDMLKDCRRLSPWTDMCKFITNAGLGPPLENEEGVFSDTSWYATNQFAVDLIFNNRMKQYDCLTNDSSLAAAFFVPFYAGFDVARYLWGHNTSTRDAASLDLVNWLQNRPEWKIMGGKDHFLVAGRITWDFRRLSDKESDWGSKFLLLPAAKNMSLLVIESSPWSSNDFAIPYPTYFHPAKDDDISDWQERMRNLDRKWLFSFAGAPRPGIPDSIRGELINQCRNSDVGKLLECHKAEESKCHSPSSIMQMFQSSIFCLQPQGDSYTRRSAFDSMLAGCIPVFFHPGSAYAQYTWHLPRNYTKYSVFIQEDDIRNRKLSIEEKLSEISAEQVKMMREEVINLIPRLIYADPRSKLVQYKDAFDVSVEAIINKVTKLRGDRTRDDEYPEAFSWKYDLLGDNKYDEHGHVKPHEWDSLFRNNDNGINKSIAKD